MVNVSIYTSTMDPMGYTIPMCLDSHRERDDYAHSSYVF